VIALYLSKVLPLLPAEKKKLFRGEYNAFRGEVRSAFDGEKHSSFITEKFLIRKKKMSSIFEHPQRGRGPVSGEGEAFSFSQCGRGRGKNLLREIPRWGEPGFHQSFRRRSRERVRSREERKPKLEQ